jgi:hypothetical protein
MNEDKIKSLNVPVYVDYLIDDLEARVAIEDLEERLEMVSPTPDCWECGVLCFFN